MRRTLTASPSTGSVATPGALEVQLLRVGERPDVVAEPAQQVGGIEGRDPPHFLSGVQARQRR